MIDSFVESFGSDAVCAVTLSKRRVKTPPSEFVQSKDKQAGWVAMNCGEKCCLLFARSVESAKTFVEEELDLRRYYDEERSRVTVGPIRSELVPAFKSWADTLGVPILETQGTVFQSSGECPPPCPDEFEVKPGLKAKLRDAVIGDAEVIGEHWDHGCGASLDTTIRLIQEVIASGNPGAVVEINGAPAAWTLQ